MKKYPRTLPAIIFSICVALPIGAHADDKQTCFAETGDLAIAACRRAIASGRFQQRELAELQNEIGAEYLRFDEKEKAVAILSDAIKSDPNFVTAYVNRASAYRADFETDKALADYAQIKKLDPKSAYPYIGRGLMYLGDGDDAKLDSAASEFQRALQLDPKSKFPPFYLGRVQMRRGNYAKAVEMFNAALAIDPKSAEILEYRGSAYVRLKDLDKAFADMTAALAQDKKRAEARTTRAEIYTQKKQYREAIVDLDYLLNNEGKFDRYYFLKGEALLLSGDYAGAINEYSSAIKVAYSDDSTYYFGRALANIAADQPALALPDLDRALSISPDNLRIRAYRERVYRRMLAFTEAMNDSNIILKTERGVKVATNWFVRGVTNFATGNAPQALSDFLEASRLEPAYLYSSIWIKLAAKRAGKGTGPEIDKAAEALASKGWPYPVFELLRGQKQPAEVLAAATDKDQTCEAEFYIGVWKMDNGQRDEGARLIASAADKCPPNFIESIVARAEVKRFASK